MRTALRRAVARYVRLIGRDDAGALELALAEILNNVVEHACRDMTDGVVTMSLRLAGPTLHCSVEDNGVEMPVSALRALDPASYETPDPEHLTEGGYGWHLIHSLSDDLRYERRDEANRLEFCLPVRERLRGSQGSR